MIFWIVIAAMTALAIVAVLFPLLRRESGAAAGGSDAEVYRDQLAEVERDFARGVIDETEAKAARIEVSRRLLAATDIGAAKTGKTLSRGPVLAAIGVAIPVVAIGLYLVIGNPGLKGEPLAARMQENPHNQPLIELVARVEGHLRNNPDDGRGWAVIAPVYGRLGRFDEAVAAYRSAIRLLGSSPDRQADLGEAIVQQSGGMISEAAQEAFEASAAGDQPSPKGLFYLALAAEQDEKLADARKIWQRLLDTSPQDAPWVPEVRDRLGRVEVALGIKQPPAVLPGPDADQVRAASEMSAGDRQAMIENMIAQLDERLTRDGGTADEWVRLIRSFMVLDKPDDAKAALARARDNLAKDPDALAQVNAAAGSFGLGG